MAQAYFIKHVGASNINGLNIGLYRHGHMVRARVEDVASGRGISSRDFESVAVFEAWYQTLDGDGSAQLLSAMADISGY